jgi:AraC-like DNA-binding protein
VIKTFGMAPGDSFEPHTHDDHQLAWAATGVLIVRVEAGSWVLPPTRALWIPAGVSHQVITSGRSRMRALYLHAERCPIGWAQPQPVVAPPLLAELIGYLAADSDKLGDERRTRAEAVLFDLLQPASCASIDAPRPADPRAADVADALLADPADGRNLEAWGRAVGASGRTLARAFLHDTGLPFGRWRTTARLQAALPRLAAGESVATVAHRVGYGTPSAFVAAFRRETGLAPGSYFNSDNRQPTGRLPARGSS